MPIERVKHSVKATTDRIRRHWSHEETHRREQMAELMQMQLMRAMGFRPAPVVEKS